MVESYLFDVYNADCDFESMLTMDTIQQHTRNTERQINLLEKVNNIGLFDDNFFDEDQEICVPT